MQGHLVFRLTRQVVRVSLSQLQARVLSTSNLAKALGCPSSKSTFRVEPGLIIMVFFLLLVYYCQLKQKIVVPIYKWNKGNLRPWGVCVCVCVQPKALGCVCVCVCVYSFFFFFISVWSSLNDMTHNKLVQLVK